MRIIYNRCYCAQNTALENALNKIQAYKEKYGTNYYPCCCNLFNNLFLSAIDVTETEVATGGVIPFSTVLRDNGITLTAPGTITLPTAGRYLVNWTVNATNNSGAAAVLSTSLNTVTPAASVVATASTAGEIADGATGTITGSAIVTVAGPTTLNITNTSADDITTSLINGSSASLNVTKLN